MFTSGQLSLQLEREAYKSSSTFADVFNQVTSDPGSLALTQPNGQPIPTTSAEVNAAIASALPTSGKLASDQVLKAVRDLLQRLITELANANTADSIAEREALKEAAYEIAGAVSGSELK